jgi:hypothetical protein
MEWNISVDLGAVKLGDKFKVVLVRGSVLYMRVHTVAVVFTTNLGFIIILLCFYSQMTVWCLLPIFFCSMVVLSIGGSAGAICHQLIEGPQLL